MRMRRQQVFGTGGMIGPCWPPLLSLCLHPCCLCCLSRLPRLHRVAGKPRPRPILPRLGLHRRLPSKPTPQRHRKVPRRRSSSTGGVRKRTVVRLARTARGDGCSWLRRQSCFATQRGRGLQKVRIARGRCGAGTTAARWQERSLPRKLRPHQRQSRGCCYQPDRLRTAWLADSCRSLPTCAARRRRGALRLPPRARRPGMGSLSRCRIRRHTLFTSGTDCGFFDTCLDQCGRGRCLQVGQGTLERRTTSTVSPSPSSARWETFWLPCSRLSGHRLRS